MCAISGDSLPKQKKRNKGNPPPPINKLKRNFIDSLNLISYGCLIFSNSAKYEHFMNSKSLCSTSTSQCLWLPNLSIISWDAQTLSNLQLRFFCLLCAASWKERGYLFPPQAWDISWIRIYFKDTFLPCGETFKSQRSAESLRIHNFFHLANSRERVKKQNLTVRRHK